PVLGSGEVRPLVHSFVDFAGNIELAVVTALMACMDAATAARVHCRLRIEVTLTEHWTTARLDESCIQGPLGMSVGVPRGSHEQRNHKNHHENDKESLPPPGHRQPPFLCVE